MAGSHRFVRIDDYQRDPDRFRELRDDRMVRVARTGTRIRKNACLVNCWTYPYRDPDRRSVVKMGIDVRCSCHQGFALDNIVRCRDRTLAGCQ
jgi:hypothetical protein